MALKITTTAVLVDDTKRYHKYQVANVEASAGIIGTVYVPRNGTSEPPKSITITMED